MHDPRMTSYQHAGPPPQPNGMAAPPGSVGTPSQPNRMAAPPGSVGTPSQTNRMAAPPGGVGSPPQPNRMAAPPGGTIRPPFNYADPPYGHCYPCPSMSSDGRCAGMQPSPRMMGPTGGPFGPAEPGDVELIMREMQALQKMMFDLQGGMWHLQGQIVQFQQTIAASGAVGSLSHSAATQTSLPTQEQPKVSSEGAQVQAHQTTDSQDGDKGFQDLPPEIIGKIMSFCSTEDRRQMRCVSKWCFNVVSTAFEELFGTIYLRLDNFCEIYKNLITKEVRMELDLDDDSYATKILLQHHLEFKNLKRLELNFNDLDDPLNLCEAILRQYGDHLEHLGLKNFDRLDDTVIQVPHLPKLSSLLFDFVGRQKLHSIVNAVNKENITHLSLEYVDPYANLSNLIFPKLRCLEIWGPSDDGEAALELIKCHKNTLTKLKLILDDVDDFKHFDIYVPNLEILELDLPSECSLSLIEKNKDTICELRLITSGHPSFPVVEMPRLKRLYLEDYDDTSVLNCIMAFGTNIEELWLDQIRKSAKEVKNLKKMLKRFTGKKATRQSKR